MHMTKEVILHPLEVKTRGVAANVIADLEQKSLLYTAMDGTQRSLFLTTSPDSGHQDGANIYEHPPARLRNHIISIQIALIAC